MLYGLFIRVVTPLVLFPMHSWEIVALTTSGNRVRHIVSFRRTQLPGYWDTDHDRLRTRNTRPSNAQCRGRGGIATYRGMSAHPIIGGSPLYLALKLCHKVAHNPNIDLLILTFACTYINKKLCLKMCFLRKLLLCASRTYILASSTINCAENVVMHFQTRV